jgi:hypothetical protein
LHFINKREEKDICKDCQTGRHSVTTHPSGRFSDAMTGYFLFHQQKRENIYGRTWPNGRHGVIRGAARPDRNPESRGLPAKSGSVWQKATQIPQTKRHESLYRGSPFDILLADRLEQPSLRTTSWSSTERLCLPKQNALWWKRKGLAWAYLLTDLPNANTVN